MYFVFLCAMKKRLLFLVLLSGSFSGLFSQIPDGYYDAAEGLDSAALKSALYGIIKGHTEFPYSSSSTDTWDILKLSDRDPANASNVILFYTGRSVNGAQEYNDGSGYNREHVWAKSRGDFGTSPGPGTDTHHLRPSDISTNADRGNFWFDNGGIAHFDEGQATGCYYSTAKFTWEPREEVKGDVARIIFYMATRYEGENGEPDLQVIEDFPSNDYTNDPVHARLSTLMVWNEEDPVDDFERNRNEVVYSYQKNRNPFIDHPEYVNYIWGEDRIVEAGMESEFAKQIRLWPNPVRDRINVNLGAAGSCTYEIYSISGKSVRRGKSEASNWSMDLTELEKGVYLLRVQTARGISTRKFVKE